MAKETLSTDYKDDVLASAMDGKRRYNMIQNSDGTVSFEDVTDYTQVGSTFGAAQINATNEAVNNAADASKIIDSLETIKANTQSGYIAGALAVKELNSNLGNFEIKNVLYLNGNVTGTVPSGYKKSYFIPYRVSGKYSAKVNGVEVLSDTNASTFTVFEVKAGDTFITTGSTGTRVSILIQV